MDGIPVPWPAVTRVGGRLKPRGQLAAREEGYARDWNFGRDGEWYADNDT